MEVPKYISCFRVIYFRNCALIYDSEDEPQNYNITGCIPQGSVLGPLLWKIMYDVVLKLHMPADTKTIKFFDDVAVVITAKYADGKLGRCDNPTVAFHEGSTTGRPQNRICSSDKPEVCHHTNCWRLYHFLTVVTAIPGCPDRHKATIRRASPYSDQESRKRHKLLSNIVDTVLMYAAPIWSRATPETSYV